MEATQLWAEELTRQAAGKHHIGDFLPPEELERFMERVNSQFFIDLLKYPVYHKLFINNYSIAQSRKEENLIYPTIRNLN